MTAQHKAEKEARLAAYAAALAIWKALDAHTELSETVRRARKKLT